MTPKRRVVSARAQQQGKLPTVGILGSNSAAWSHLVSALVQRLRELGYIENRTVAIEYRWTEGHDERYAAMAAELVALKVDVIVALSTPAIVAAKKATAVIPIVFPIASDPVGDGLVASLARPGGNLTGLSNQQPDLAGKRLEILREIVPGLSRLAVLANGHSPTAMLNVGEVQGRLPSSASKSTHLISGGRTISRPLSSSSRAARRQFMWLAMPSSSIIRLKLTGWRWSRDCRRCTTPEDMSKPEVSFPTERVSRTCSAAPGITSIRFSRAQNPPICRSNSRPSSSWSSTSKPRERSG